MSDSSMSAFHTFMSEWTKDAHGVKPLVERLHACLAALEGVGLEYRGRPGVSHSVRARHEAQHDRSLFVLVDVIDDDPDARWLSVCFYADLVDDPEERGDVVPGGLMGEDARCFDVEAPDSETAQYLLNRLKEAAGRAGGRQQPPEG